MKPAKAFSSIVCRLTLYFFQASSGYPAMASMGPMALDRSFAIKIYCPVGGNPSMAAIAQYLGKVAPEQEPAVAVVRCQGKPEYRAKVNSYDGASSCAVSAALYMGDTGCQYGCLGLGDCVVVCNFDAIQINPETGIPEVVDEKCTACGACVKACPKAIIELRKKASKDRKIFVSCVSKDKGGVAKKACSVACIGCGKCVKTCPFEAITLENNLAYIDVQKCKLCRKCVVVCPTAAIVEVNFPPRPTVVETSSELADK